MARWGVDTFIGTVTLSAVIETLSKQDAPRLDVVTVHRDHGDFVWRSLQTLGARGADLSDLHQEVFLVVHQRLHTFDHSAKVTTWLFGICLRVVSAHRRRAWRRRETPEADPGGIDRASHGALPDAAMEARQRSARLASVLDAMDLEKRAVFVMFEIEEMSCERIAEMMGVPLGTVYTRLRAGRRQFEQLVARARARGDLR